MYLRCALSLKYLHHIEWVFVLVFALYKVIFANPVATDLYLWSISAPIWHASMQGCICPAACDVRSMCANSFAACRALLIYMTAHDTKRVHFVNTQNRECYVQVCLFSDTLAKINAV